MRATDLDTIEFFTFIFKGLISAALSLGDIGLLFSRYVGSIVGESSRETAPNLLLFEI